MEVRRLPTFDDWLGRLRDRRAAARIVARISRLEGGNGGDRKGLGGGIAELRVDYGPGYRIYFTQRGEVVVILLCGGDKNSQRSDIKRARALAADLEE